MKKHKAVLKEIFKRFVGLPDAIYGSSAVVVLMPTNGQMQGLMVHLIQKIATEIEG